MAKKTINVEIEIEQEVLPDIKKGTVDKILSVRVNGKEAEYIRRQFDGSWYSLFSSTYVNPQDDEIKWELQLMEQSY